MIITTTTTANGISNFPTHSQSSNNPTPGNNPNLPPQPTASGPTRTPISPRQIPLIITDNTQSKSENTRTRYTPLPQSEVISKQPTAPSEKGRKNDTTIITDAHPVNNNVLNINNAQPIRENGQQHHDYVALATQCCATVLQCIAIVLG